MKDMDDLFSEITGKVRVNDFGAENANILATHSFVGENYAGSTCSECGLSYFAMDALKYTCSEYKMRKALK